MTLLPVTRLRIQRLGETGFTLSRSCPNLDSAWAALKTQVSMGHHQPSSEVSNLLYHCPSEITTYSFATMKDTFNSVVKNRQVKVPERLEKECKENQYLQKKVFPIEQLQRDSLKMSDSHIRNLDSRQPKSFT